MDNYHNIYKLGVAILLYAIYCRIPLFVHAAEVIDDTIGNVNDTSHKISAREYFVYYQGVQGRPGVDFPVYARIPRTSFTCKEVESGYYADLETDCQVFHICNDGTKVSFLCPNGTIFQQSDLICDWWFKVNCTNSPNLYEESAEQLRESLIRRKASRRVYSNKPVVQQTPMPLPAAQHMSRKVDAIYSDHRHGRQRHVFAADSSEEMQIPQESASFISDYNRPKVRSKTVNNFKVNSHVTNAQAVTNPYPNHRETYSDIQDPKNYYSSALKATTNSLNNGRPFIVSTPKVGGFTTEKPSFRYSPTVPSVTKSNYITPLPTSTSTKKYMSNYGERIRLANSYIPKPLPKAYSNVETFTSPPSIANGKPTTSRKPKGKNSFTIGLNTLQGAVPIKLGATTTTTQKPSFISTTKDAKDKDRGKIKLSLSSGGPAKTVSTANKTPKPKVRLDLGDIEVPKLQLSLENEIPSVTTRPQTENGFYITKSSTDRERIIENYNIGSITGSQNTYIPTTSKTPATTYSYVSNTFGFVKPTGVPKPKPFELASTTLSPPTRITTQDFYDYETTTPNYQLSSASPFTNVPPTLPSIYHNNGQLQPPRIPENVNNMLETLQEIANVRFGKSQNLNDEDRRPGLIVPPSVGPQTLHTLAVYFANALDSLVDESNSTTEAQTESTTETQNNLVPSLLSQDTINKYKELFMIMANDNTELPPTDEESEDEQEDLQREHSNNAVQSPRVRQLAKVFTQALSSYLDDPEKFKQVLHGIRPTEPPPLNTLPTDVSNNEEDELLNFSDADIKPENPRLPTPAPPNPTWGYILAYNNNTASEFKSNQIDEENLQSADSQSFVPGFNEINSDNNNNQLPNNHWTSSDDVTKLWRTTLYVNPLHINQNFDVTESLLPTSTEDIDDLDHEQSKSHEAEEDINQPVDLTEFNTERQIDYELRSLPKFDLNSTSVHGLLIDFMNATADQEDGRLQRILRKLNTTQDEFLNKMKEIEKNPLTKRLILLLVSECGNTTSTKMHAVRDIINLAQRENIQLQNYSLPSITNNQPNSPLGKYIDPSLKDDDQDSRALQLLNSLYSIASKYGK